MSESMMELESQKVHTKANNPHVTKAHCSCTVYESHRLILSSLSSRSATAMS